MITLFSRLNTFLFCTAFFMLFCCTGVVQSQPVPVLNCVSVEDNGSLTVNWSIPAGTFDGFRLFYKRTDNPVSNSAPDFDNTTTNYTIPVADAQTVGYDIYLVTFNYGPPFQILAESDHLFSMVLEASSPTGGIARLEWNKFENIHNGVFNIYRKDDELLPFPATPIDQVNNTAGNGNLVYLDTIIAPYCADIDLYYRVEFSSGSCVANSCIASGIFSDKILPAEPTLSYVTVNDNGRAEIYWEPSTSSDISGYVIGRVEAPLFRDYDTIGNFSYFLDDDNSFPPYADPGIEVVTYTVKAMDLCGQSAGTSSLQFPHNTILLTGETSSRCDRQATLSWNAYNNMDPPVTSYKVFRSNSGGAAVEITSIAAAGATYSFLDPELLTPGLQYTYHVEAISSDGLKKSKSCKLEVFPNPEPVSEFDMDYLTVVDNDHIELNLFGGPPAVIAAIEVKRSALDGSSVAVIFSEPWSGVSPVGITDTSARVNETSYYYSIAALDACGFELASTLVSRSIFLQIEDLGNDEYRLSWNAYEDWGASLLEYNIFRIADGIVEPGFPVLLTPSELVFNDFAGNLVANRTTYYVEAVRNDEIRSRSNEVLLPADAEVLIPNAFRPNGVSPVFKPTVKNIEQGSYLFAIYNRWGQLIFDSNNPAQGWNGLYNGNEASQDIYAWILSFKDLTGKKTSKRGSVMLLR